MYALCRCGCLSFLTCEWESWTELLMPVWVWDYNWDTCFRRILYSLAPLPCMIFFFSIIFVSSTRRQAPQGRHLHCNVPKGENRALGIVKAVTYKYRLICLSNRNFFFKKSISILMQNNILKSQQESTSIVLLSSY